jgi:flagellar biosynthesis/type III secretory pathway chaperone
MDANNRVKDLITITSRLAEVLARENDALRARRHGELDEILDQKTTLGRIYESRLEGLADDKDALKGVDPALRERLRGLGDKVNDLIEENARLLRVAIEANRRVVDMIAEAVKASAPGPGIYGKKGTLGGERRRTAGNLAFSLDRSL